MAWMLVWALALSAGEQDATALLNRAYEALRARHYDTALPLFREGIELDPARPSVRKDYAYALLKVGENEEARDQFAEVVRLDPSDHHAALEYAFLCYETGRTAEARRTFGRLCLEASGELRDTAQRAFDNVDRPLREGISKWLAVTEADPENFSAHEELARLAERRDEYALAAGHFERAWRLRPAKRYLLVSLGKMLLADGRTEQAHAVLLAASRGPEPRAAELARELLPRRYPYLYEFRNALEFEPGNIELRREFAYQLLLMGRNSEAEEQFRILAEGRPEDLLSAAQLGFLLHARGEAVAASGYLQRVLNSGDVELAERVRSFLGLPREIPRPPEKSPAQLAAEARLLGMKSFEAGYLPDARKYLMIAHQYDPADFEVMLKLGWVHNLMRQDTEAASWFALARRSPDLRVAREAATAYRNLKPGEEPVRLVAWMLPLYSSRWRDVFAYGQIKTEFRAGRLPLRPYLSVRFIGDAKGSRGAPQSSLGPTVLLSENAFIGGVGVVTNPWKGFTGWVEAGQSAGYTKVHGAARSRPDYRGGVYFTRGAGNPLQGESTGWFADTNDDIVYLSRYRHDVIFSLQNRIGWTFANGSSLGGLQVQAYWNLNLSFDLRREAWANFGEAGPGVRFRWKWMPPALAFSVNWLRGDYLIQDPAWTAYRDVRVGVWYAFSR